MDALFNQLGEAANHFSLIPPDEGSYESDTIDFSFGNPDVKNLDLDLLSSILSRISVEHLSYATDQGSKIDRRIIAKHLKKYRNIEVSDDQIIITSGAIDAINLVARAFLNPYDIVLIEDPTYFRVAYLFKTYGAKLVTIPSYKNEVDIDKLHQLLEVMASKGEKPKLMYINPSFQNPTGRTLSERNRLQVLELSENYKFFILEDDVYSDLYFNSPPPKSFYSLANNDSIIQVGSVSKILFPSLRFGWMILPEILAPKIASLKSDAGTSRILTFATCQLLDSIDWNIRFSQLRNLYYSKFKCLKTLINQIPDNAITWQEPTGGFFIWLIINDVVNWGNFLDYIAAHQVKFMLGKHCSINQNESHKTIRLAYSQLSIEEICLGGDIISSAIISSI